MTSSVGRVLALNLAQIHAASPQASARTGSPAHPFLQRCASYHNLTSLPDAAIDSARKAYDLGKDVIPTLGKAFRILGNNLTTDDQIQRNFGMFAIDPCPKAQSALTRALSRDSMTSTASTSTPRQAAQSPSSPSLGSASPEHFSLHAHVNPEQLLDMVPGRSPAATSPLASASKEGFALDRTVPVEELFGIIDESTRLDPAVKGYFTSGAILNDQNWSLPFNDAFLLSGIHEGIDFQIAIPTPKPTEENLWAKAENRPRVFARELAMLRSAGYTHHAQYKPDGELLGIVFTAPEAGSKHETITLEECLSDFIAFEEAYQAHEKDPSKLKPAAERESMRKAFIEGLQDMFSCGATI